MLNSIGSFSNDWVITQKKSRLFIISNLHPHQNPIAFRISQEFLLLIFRNRFRRMAEMFLSILNNHFTIYTLIPNHLVKRPVPFANAHKTTTTSQIEEDERRRRRKKRRSNSYKINLNYFCYVFIIILAGWVPIIPSFFFSFYFYSFYAIRMSCGCVR